MSAGEDLNRAFKLLARATGDLSAPLVKKKIMRRDLIDAKVKVSEALTILDSMLSRADGKLE